jgi:acyl-coenzyme A synthetase/AMP-(fatty) acid ligase
MIRLWRGFHSEALLGLIQDAWSKDELLILCPPALKEFGFTEWLPEGEIRGVGELAGERFARRAAVPAAAFPEKPVLGVFTSGTLSGTPRLVLYSKRNLESSLRGIRSFFDPSRFDQLFCYPQPFHTFGLVLGYVHAAVHGLHLVTGQGKYARGFHEARVALRSEKVLTLGTPTHFHDLLGYLRRKKASLLPSYSCILGGAKVSVSLWHSVRVELGILEPSIGYGATEASPGVTHQPPGQAPTEEGEIGVPIPGVSVRLVQGEGVEFEGENVCLAVIEDGTLRFPCSIFLRDRLRVRRDGTFVFEGRLDLMLNRGGQKFSLERLEEAVSRAAQAEAVCVSVPDERLGEELGILLRSSPSSAPLHERMSSIQACLEREFGQTFQTAHLREIEALPLNESSKIDRRKSVSILTAVQGQ